MTHSERLLSIPSVRYCAGWSVDDWDKHLRSQGFTFYRRSKHQYLFKLGDAIYGISSSTSDNIRANKQRITSLRNLAKANNIPYLDMDK